MSQNLLTLPEVQDPEVYKSSAWLLGIFMMLEARFDNVHIDIVGPLPPSKGCMYLLTCINHFTRWPEPIPITSATAESVSQASQFGISSTVTTDHGRQFKSTLWTHLMQLLGCKTIHTTSYHPISNGFIKRFHHKSYHDSTNWMDILPMVLLRIYITLTDDLCCTTAELVAIWHHLKAARRIFDTSCANSTVPDPSCYATKLKTAMQQLKAVPPDSTTVKSLSVRT